MPSIAHTPADRAAVLDPTPGDLEPADRSLLDTMGGIA